MDIQATDTTLFDLPLSVFRSFSAIAGVPIKFCGLDGQPLPNVTACPVTGPCDILGRAGCFAEICAKNHAKAAELAASLRRPYIFNCHARLAGWAIPILRDGKPLPAAIICGGVLLMQPDSALLTHLERVASAHDVDSGAILRSLESVPVLSRERLRLIAEFIFDLADAFINRTSTAETVEAGASETIAPVHFNVGPPASVVFPPHRRKETKKERAKRAKSLMQQGSEAEVLRLVRERKPGEALESLIELVTRSEGIGDRETTTRLGLAEMFTRMFRNLADEENISRRILEKQSRLLQEALSEKEAADRPEHLGLLCRKFIAIAEQLAGTKRPRQVRAIQRFLEGNLSKKLTLGSVGRKFGIKEKALNSLIMKNCGMSFTDYVTSLRVTEARRLLQDTDSSLGEIAGRTGFKDQSYFTKVFKSQLGSTPSEFRNSCKKRPRPGSKT